ncbi:hypothetical protein IT408_01260 [Candidatus Uhrbacteria bacterium]|nr:hypothetical protein [Candidatus Uhrbacteria bacterium]
MKFPVPPPLREKTRRKSVTFLSKPVLRRVFFSSVVLWMLLFSLPLVFGLLFLPFDQILPPVLAWGLRFIWIYFWFFSGFFCGHLAGRLIVKQIENV